MSPPATVIRIGSPRERPLEWVAHLIRDALRRIAIDASTRAETAPIVDMPAVGRRVRILGAAIGAVLGLSRRHRDILLRHYLGGEPLASIAQTYRWNVLRTEAERADAAQAVIASLDSRFGSRDAWSVFVIQN